MSTRYCVTKDKRGRLLYWRVSKKGKRTRVKKIAATKNPKDCSAVLKEKSKVRLRGRRPPRKSRPKRPPLKRPPPKKPLELLDLPDELFVEALKNMDPATVARMCLTSRRLSQLCKDREVWKALYFRDVSSVPPCLPLDWEKLYGVAVTQSVYLYELMIGADEFLVLGGDNITSKAEQVLRDTRNYTKDDFEILQFDLMTYQGTPDIADLVGQPEGHMYVDFKGTEFEVNEVDSFPVREVFNLFPRLSKLKPKKQ